MIDKGICDKKCKELIDKGICDKGIMKNHSICDCDCDKSCKVGQCLDYENCKFRKRMIDKLVGKCSESIVYVYYNIHSIISHTFHNKHKHY